MEKKITFKKNYFFGGDRKDDAHDYVVGYTASNGAYIEAVEYEFTGRIDHYTVNGIPFATLKEAKDYIIANA
jgi:hypothetical protein